LARATRPEALPFGSPALKLLLHGKTRKDPAMDKKNRKKDKKKMKNRKW
jgi:hypothetical protein